MFTLYTCIIMAQIKILIDAMNYLKDPLLVAKIQSFFGVDVHDKVKLLSKVKENNVNNDELSIISRHVNKKNDCSTSESKMNGDPLIMNTINEEGHDSVIKSSKTPSDTLPVRNYFWYYLFLFSSELGDEIFYTAFITIWFWNIDAAVGRKVILVWAIVMTIGQIMKDVIRWPRPACPPAVRLQSKWSQEFGMPSTHAAVSISIPFSVILFTMNKYSYSIPLGITIVIIWSSLICVSRVYLGMHTVLDVIAGLLLAISLMLPLIPFINYMDHYLITNQWIIVILIVISIAIIIYYPTSDTWTPTRSDTTMVVSVVTGIHVGAWLNYQSGMILPTLNLPPYDVIWPSYSIIAYTILRTILGLCFAISLKIICKSLTYTSMCTVMQINPNELMKSEDSLENRDKIIVDLVYRFVYCFTFGIAIVYILPRVFTIVGLGRPGFYTEL